MRLGQRGDNIEYSTTLEVPMVLPIIITVIYKFGCKGVIYKFGCKGVIYQCCSSSSLFVCNKLHINKTITSPTKITITANINNNSIYKCV